MGSFLVIFLLSLAIISIALIGLGIQTFFSKKKKFPDTKVGHNKEMRKRKIYCIKTQQKIIDKDLNKGKNSSPECSIC